jgi:Nuclease-related domain
MSRALVDLQSSIVAELTYVVLLFLPAAAWLWSLHRKNERDKAQSKLPFTDLQRRPGGESNRLHIEELDERIDPWIIGIAFIPILLAFGLTLQRASLPTFLLYFLLSAGFVAFADRKLRPLIGERAAYRLGFHGERVVAEELNQLMFDGFHVFHDVPFDKYNMDHVLVGPNGVFVVETKTKRKRTADGKTNYEVVFDGTQLNFPTGWDTKALDQARLNKKSLSKWLSSATAIPITAEAILTIPGWFVERSVPASDVYVTNPKQIRSFVLNFDEKPLTPAEIQRAVHQLEQKCKLTIE